MAPTNASPAPCMYVCMYVELVIMEIRVDSKRSAQDELSAVSHSRDTED